MKKDQKSMRDNIQDVLCPFTDWYCTQGANDTPSHMGSEANDIIGIQNGVRYPYYAPTAVKCVRIDRQYAFTWWQSIGKVRLADGSVDYVTFLFGHDNTIDAYVGQIIKQGEQIGNMGNAGKAKAIHTHIEVGRGRQTTWVPNKYGVYCIPNQIPLENVFFMDNTNIIRGTAKWRYLKDVKVETKNYLNLSKTVDTWRIYPLDKVPIVGNECGKLNPKKFGGLSYTLVDRKENIAIINTKNFGKVQIFIGPDLYNLYSITNVPVYQVVN